VPQSLTDAQAAAGAEAEVEHADTHTQPRLRECRDCGQFQIVPALAPGMRASCLRCDGVLRQTRVDPFGLPMALNLAALMLFFLGSAMTLLSVGTAGQFHVATLFSGPESLQASGLWELAILVMVTTVAIPLGRVLCTLTVLFGLRLASPPRMLRMVFAWAEHLRPWSMVEIYLLGVFVAYVKLGSMVQIELGVALYALAGLMVVMVAGDVFLDDQAVWEEIERHEARRTRRERTAGALGARLTRMGCHTCGLVSRGRDGAHCPRCGFALHHRKTNSIARAWALLIASVILYVPANVYPVLTVISLGAGQPSTILGGVHELLAAGMWPLAALVFTASVAVPILKIFSLGFLLTTTQFGWTERLRERTTLYRMVDLVGRWSMIDIFMVSILVALVKFGAIATIQPGVGATAFAAVVILTMLAAECFDPRLMWDAAETSEQEQA